jgi:hypothetical protein
VHQSTRPQENIQQKEEEGDTQIIMIPTLTQDVQPSLTRYESKEETRNRQILSYLIEERYIAADGKSLKSLDQIAREATGSSLCRPLVEVIMKVKYPEIYDQLSTRGRAKIYRLKKAQQEKEAAQVAADELKRKQKLDAENGVVTVGQLRSILSGTKAADRIPTL